jgi:hypothetical protein
MGSSLTSAAAAAATASLLRSSATTRRASARIADMLRTASVVNASETTRSPATLTTLARAYVLAIAAEVRKPPHFRRSTGARESVAL